MSAPHVQIERADLDQYMVPSYASAVFIPVRDKGLRARDQNGRELIDFVSNIAATSLGHAYSALVKALIEQAQRIWHVSNVFTNGPTLRLARKLVDATFTERMLLANSGAEANEVTLKLARRYTNDVYNPQKCEIIAANNSFHGRTPFTVNVGGQPKYSSGFRLKLEGITHVPYNDLEALKAAVPNKTYTVALEPTQGEGGVLPAQQAYPEGARKLYDERDALLILSEVQNGIGRVGKPFAYMHCGVAPGILSSAESLDGGFPIGAILTTGEIVKYLPAGTHGITYGGSPLASAVAETALDVTNTPEVLDGVETEHERFKSRLQKIGQEYGIFSGICGMGLLIGAALTGKWKGKAGGVLNAAEKEAVMTFQAGPNVVRFASSLVIDGTEIDEGLERFERAVTKLVRG